MSSADEIEDLEFEALLAAAEASAALAGPGGLRVVVVADVPAATVHFPSDAGDAAGATEARVCDVMLSVRIARDRVAAIHVDETGDGEPADRDLLWYANQEIEDWLATQAS